MSDRPMMTIPISRVLSAAAATSVLTLICLSSGCQSPGSNISYSGSRHADAAFESASKREPIPETLFAVARILVAQGRDADAEPILRRLIAEHRQFVAGYCELAELQMRKRRLGDAVDTLAAGLAAAPNEPSLLNNLGMCWMLRDQHEKALEYFIRAAALAPDDARLRANVAAALGMQGRYDESLAVYRQVMNAAHAHYNLGVLSEARQDHDHAESQFAAARRLDSRMR